MYKKAKAKKQKCINAGIAFAVAFPIKPDSFLCRMFI